ncbi:hypothetical protein DID78_05770 [Candidatus Marinamargulisbacteria bacterium SCGC AG-343-D04]|nr:hypothetical protein DID78_05770 [Candidatus Marinamargulisbacteria bacterium SCGC AG-343-D04]
MTESLLDLYKRIITIKDGMELEHLYPEKKQETILENLISAIQPESSDQDLLMITKCCLHFLEIGASDSIKDDAETCLSMIKTFSINQNKENVQLLCFKNYLRILYSRWLPDEQKNTCINEINEFHRSSHILIQFLYLLFYFDDKLNPDYNLLKQDLSHFPISKITSLCPVYQSLCEHSTDIKEMSLPLTCSISTESITQRFLNQFIYGDHGLRHKHYDKTRNHALLNTLISLAHSTSKSASSHQKAIIKHLDFLYNALNNAEKKEDIDHFLELKEELQFIKNSLSPEKFEKLKPNVIKSLNKCLELH